MNHLKSDHQKRVEEFMRLAKQKLPSCPDECMGMDPHEFDTLRLLRARLIYEEAMETINEGLGVHISREDGEFSIDQEFNLVEMIDGCCDLSVVTIGTLSAFGLPDEVFLKIVDENNLAKFGPGHSWREDGKLIKPPGHKKPMFATILHELAHTRGGRYSLPESEESKMERFTKELNELIDKFGMTVTITDFIPDGLVSDEVAQSSITIATALPPREVPEYVPSNTQSEFKELPEGIRFYDRISNCEMYLVTDQDSGWWHWIFRKHPDGQWVSVRKVDGVMRERIEMANNQSPNQIPRLAL